MRPEKELGADYEKWSLEEWLFCLSSQSQEHLRGRAAGNQPYYQRSVHGLEWEFKRDRAANVVVPGFVMADNLAREMDR